MNELNCGVKKMKVESDAYYIPCIKVLDKSRLQKIRKQLESMHLLNKSYKKYIKDGILFTDSTQIRANGGIVTEESTFTDEKAEIFLENIELNGLEKTDVEYLKELWKDNSVKFVNYNLAHAIDHLISTLNPKGIIEEFVSSYLLNIGKFDLFQLVKGHIPKKYTLYEPLILFNNSNTLENVVWEQRIFAEVDRVDFYEKLLSIPQFSNKYRCIAVNLPIPLEINVKRLPLQIQPIYGDFGKYFNGSTPLESCLKIPASVMENPTENDLKNSLWCHTIQNGIHQYWAPLHVMFSRGNIHEKQRILNTFQNVEGNDIIDLYCGIGYFTLCYLKMGCRRIFCWDINPWSIEGLIRGCKANGFKIRVIQEDEEFDLSSNVDNLDKDVRAFIFLEDNRKAVQRLKNAGLLRLAHVNLGYIPSSKYAWPTTAQVIAEHSSIPTMVHIHHNVQAEKISEFSRYTVRKFDRLMVEYDRGHNYESCAASKLKDKGGAMLDYNYDTSDDEQENDKGAQKRWKTKCCKVEKIKTYAPTIWHVCVDAEISRIRK